MMRVDCAVKRAKAWMPETHHFDDKQHIYEQMQKIDESLQLHAAVSYSRRYKKAMSLRGKSIAKKRHSVNKWLADVVNFVGEPERLAELIRSD